MGAIVFVEYSHFPFIFSQIASFYSFYAVKYYECEGELVRRKYASAILLAFPSLRSASLRKMALAYLRLSQVPFVFDNFYGM